MVGLKLFFRVNLISRVAKFANFRGNLISRSGHFKDFCGNLVSWITKFFIFLSRQQIKSLIFFSFFFLNISRVTTNRRLNFEINLLHNALFYYSLSIIKSSKAFLLKSSSRPQIVLKAPFSTSAIFLFVFMQLIDVTSLKSLDNCTKLPGLP